MIEGKLVNLRAREMTDVDRMYRWINDREVTRYLNMRYAISYLAEEAWVRASVEAPMGYERPGFAIETKHGQHIGTINFHLVTPEDRATSLGIMIGEQSHWSRGYGTDAMLTFMRFGFEEMNLNRIELTVDAANARARACYRKCGLTDEARLRQHRFAGGAYGDTVLMGILRSEWRRKSTETEGTR